MKHIISLGAGVQSSTMALMAAHGEITPMPECAIFADTQAEPRAVYEWLDWLETQLPFPVHRVSAGSLFDIIGRQREKGTFAHMPLPAFVRGADGKPSLLNRSCTRDFKIRPIRRELKRILGIERRRAPGEAVVTQWMGISTDESQRAKPSGEPWIEHRWPLLELGMSREDCLRWMRDHGFERPPRSSCTFCPYHDNAEWLDIQGDPESWAQAVEIDDRIRALRARQRVSQDVFLHRSLRPLKELVFKRVDRGPDLDSGFQNVVENEIWSAIKTTNYARWFAPVHYISGLGTILLMEHTLPAPRSVFPKRMPEFVGDLKYSNFGLLKGRLVCHDYGTLCNFLAAVPAKMKMRRAKWWDPDDGSTFDDAGRT